MSALKKQLQLILPELSKESNANQQPEIKRHLYLIKAVCSSTKSIKQVCESRGVSTDQFYHWGKLLKRFKNLDCLRSKSKRPKHSPNQTSKHIERKILILRKAEPSHGSERISFDLKRLFKIVCAPMTVYNVLIRLKLISREYQKKLTKRHHRRYRRPFAGYMQMDIKYVPYRINGQQFYEFNIVDHCTTWRFIRVFRNITHANIKIFLKGIEENCPFAIEEIQTDNGQEFTDKYRHGRAVPSGQHVLDLWCKEQNIVHRLIPIGQKELNGKVENTHKQDDREFYAGKQAISFENLERNMRSYNGRWNEVRATKALGWKTPNQSIVAAIVRAIVFIKMIVERYAPDQKPVYSLDLNGNAVMSVPRRPPKGPIKIKIKKLSAVDRYLQWQEEDQKKYKAYFPLPVMSQIFSQSPPRPPLLHVERDARPLLRSAMV
jgi:transposase InsO family protein